jgi:hypothetical protein
MNIKVLLALIFAAFALTAIATAGDTITTITKKTVTPAGITLSAANTGLKEMRIVNPSAYQIYIATFSISSTTIAGTAANYVWQIQPGWGTFTDATGYLNKKAWYAASTGTVSGYCVIMKKE